MRHEFSRGTKKAALLRSGGVCEASGTVYGLEPETRCTVSLGLGVEFDHYPLPAHAENSNTVENCQAVCPAHHRFKTRTFDIPVEAKLKRVQRKHGPVEGRGVKKPIPQRPNGWPAKGTVKFQKKPR